MTLAAQGRSVMGAWPYLAREFEPGWALAAWGPDGEYVTPGALTLLSQACYNRAAVTRAASSMAEQVPFKHRVRGSNPRWPIANPRQVRGFFCFQSRLSICERCFRRLPSQRPRPTCGSPVVSASVGKSVCHAEQPGLQLVQLKRARYTADRRHVQRCPGQSQTWLGITGLPAPPDGTV
jgi:hypothetical protein